MSIQDDKTRINFVNNKTFQDLEKDEILALVLVKLIEIVGEAASRISKEYQVDHPEIPWSAMIGMRNRLFFSFTLNLGIWREMRVELVLSGCPDWVLVTAVFYL